jgi:hypothetical protein
LYEAEKSDMRIKLAAHEQMLREAGEGWFTNFERHNISTNNA